MSPEKLHPRDVEADHGGVDDMTKLTYLNEPGVLDNLHRRYALNEIYVSSGYIFTIVKLYFIKGTVFPFLFFFKNSFYNIFLCFERV